MVRHRIPSSSVTDRSLDKDPRGVAKKPKKTSSSSFWLKLLIGFGTCGVTLYYVYRGYLETRVHTPLQLPSAVERGGLQVPELFWGSYRPGVYFGMKTRSPADLLFGIMWMLPELVKPNDLGLRHWSEQGDNLESFGWLQHDGERFGVQEIKDRGLLLKTSFVKLLDEDTIAKGGQWTARVSAQATKKHVTEMSLFLYVGMDENATGFKLRPVFGGADSTQMTGIVGKTGHLGDFRIDFVSQNLPSIKETFYACVDSPGPHKFTESMMQRLRLFQMGNAKVIGIDSQHLKSDNPDFIVYQINAKLPFEIDIVFSPHQKKDESLTGEDYGAALQQKQAEFNEKFEETFGLHAQGYNDDQIRFAQAAMSNMVGGIGYFYGHSIVQSDLNNIPVKYWDAPLYTAVPSRSFFPRGFLWDEGFHNLLISKWSKPLSADIVAHWLDLMNVEGWIPREQILGLEARAKVPAEFVVQNNKNANPPTLLLTLHSMVQDLTADGKIVPEWFKVYLSRIWPRLEVWYAWFNSTQKGNDPGTFRWRGRNATALFELNPKTLTSGLDDYPRASHPTEQERHVDLRCWMALASKLMADIGQIIGKTKDSQKYAHTAEFLHDNSLLDATHWSEEHGAYLDYGLHSEDVTLQKPRPPPGQHQQMQKQRVVHEEPKYQYVNQVGYVSLFPFILQVVEPDSPKLGKVLQDLKNPAKFWTPYGLRSLSKSASIYMKKNTEHDAPYWRGPIWININFLAVRALHYYAQLDGPYKKEALEIYTKLRRALIDNVIQNYEKTGYIWEQYNDRTGQGQGCRPFTGWSSLVVLMMGEKY